MPPSDDPSPPTPWLSAIPRPHSWRQVLGRYAVALVGVLLVSLVIEFAVDQRQVNAAAMLYLVAVLAAAVWGGRGPAILASLAAFLVFDWFFVHPFHTFAVSDPNEWIALVLFLLTAVVTGQLAATLRLREREAVERQLQAEQREREAVLLYDIARLLADPDLAHALPAVAERVSRELGLAALGIQLVENGQPTMRALVGQDQSARDRIESQAAPSSRILGQGAPPTEGRHGSPGRWVRVVPNRSRRSPDGQVLAVTIQVQSERIGTLFLAPAGPATFGPSDDRLLSGLAAQIGSAVDRERLRLEATEAEILRRTDELKTALLNAVSHDLRTPLASIIASAGSLRQSDVDWSPQERADFLQAIEEQALRLNRLVGNLLDLSRIEAGSLRPEKGWYDLSALVDDVLGRLRSTLAGRSVTVDLPSDLPPVHLDYVEIDQVLTNLIENAARYTPPGTPIHLTADRRKDEVRLTVADRGPGIPAESLSRIFDRFYRLGDSAPSGARPAGSGLGLAVARGLVEAHGGRLWAENRPGGGSLFTFALPLPAEQSPAPTSQAAA